MTKTGNLINDTYAVGFSQKIQETENQLKTKKMENLIKDTKALVSWARNPRKQKMN